MNFEPVFDQSYERVRRAHRRQMNFFEAFYSRFVVADPRVAEHFKHSDMLRQQRMLEKSFYRLLVFYATNNADDFLERIAEKHSKKGLNIDPDLYDLWLDTLLETVAEFDPEFDDNVELAWRLVLSTGITYMKFKHDHC